MSSMNPEGIRVSWRHHRLERARWSDGYRAIDLHESEVVDESAFTALIRHAVALNRSGKSKPAKKTKS